MEYMYSSCSYTPSWSNACAYFMMRREKFTETYSNLQVYLRICNLQEYNHIIEKSKHYISLVYFYIM